MQQPDTFEQAAATQRAATSCDHCFGIGWRIEPCGRVERCPTLIMGLEHEPLTDTGRAIDRSIRVLQRGKKEVDAVLFDIARTLAKFTAAAPCASSELIDRHFGYKRGAENQRRLVTKAIAEMHDEWLLPVGSSKDKPCGYWIITSETEFKAWFERACNEPITRLTRLHRLAKANFPVFAEQIEFDFWSDASGIEKALPHDA